jgi:predicted glycogen debranching enzyme
VFDLDSTGQATVIASTQSHYVTEANRYRTVEIERRKVRDTAGANETIRLLATAADQFIVTRGPGKTVIAGYPWFADWGRDTMIALPGLALVTGRTEIAKSILREFANNVDQGMLPNRFPDAGEAPEYNTVDATLWYFEAVRSLLYHTNDYEFVRENLYNVLKDVIEWHVKGTRYRIHVDHDGLLFCGEPGVQLTWMDAKVGDWVVTPRHGKPVEIQALWYNALRVMEHLAEKFSEPIPNQQYGALADKARASFNEMFWNEQAGCLYDVVNGEKDASIRPNQLIAISLANTMLSKERAASVLRMIERELLTPRGLRTLSPRDPAYIGRYEGGPSSRDGAYHQGTVWPWLMGPYITAYARTLGSKAGREFAAMWLENFAEHLQEVCLGQVSEIFDGDAPHQPRGCVAQAWSVAELLRAVVEDVEQPQSKGAGH